MPEYRTRVANSSEKNAACGPYIAPWNSRPTVTARVTSPNDLESISGKKANAHRPTPAAPIR